MKTFILLLFISAPVAADWYCQTDNYGNEICVETGKKDNREVYCQDDGYGNTTCVTL